MGIVLFGCDKEDDDNKNDQDGEGAVTEITVKFENASDVSDISKVKLIMPDYTATGGVIVATADFKNGSCTLNLPETVDAKCLRPINGLWGNVTISNNNANISEGVDIIGFNSQDEMISYFYCEKNEGNVFSIVYYAYADSDVNVSGNAIDNKDPNNVGVFSLFLKKGWNAVYEKITETTQNGETSYHTECTSSPIKGLKWVAD